MIFYTSLFIACVIAAFIALYIFKALEGVGRSVYKAILPSAKANVTGHRERVSYRSTKNHTKTPWGWTGNDKKVRQHGSNPASANGASGLDAFINDHGKQSAAVGWPYRQEKSDLTGKSYKVSRKAVSANTNRGSKGKPWGW
jgi:hypothetical protein